MTSPPSTNSEKPTKPSARNSAKRSSARRQVIEQLAICLFARGHALLMGVPGLAKTLLVSSVAQTFDLTFNRIQFTPDLMPADITGTDIIQESGVGGRREFEFIKGPVSPTSSWPTKSTAPRQNPVGDA